MVARYNRHSYHASASSPARDSLRDGADHDVRPHRRRRERVEDGRELLGRYSRILLLVGVG